MPNTLDAECGNTLNAKAMSKTHPIVRFAKARKLLEGEAAQKLGISPQMLSDMKKGRRRPSVESALAIEKASDGAVKFAELLLWKPAA